MKWETANQQTRLYLITAIILLVGLGSSLLIYLAAENDPDNVVGYEAVGGYVYPVMPEDSKRYIHDLELYGGKTNVLVNDFMRWFAGLWHGKPLAVTIACITLFISFCFFYIARHLPSDSKSDARDDNNPGGND